jgi:hypothetical protein
MSGSAAEPHRGSQPRRLRVLVDELRHVPNGQKLGEYAVALDAWMRQWAQYAARKDLPETERMRAIGMLASMRADFNALVAEARGASRGDAASHDLGTALDGLDQAGVQAIGQALGLPLETRYRPLFEVKAALYVEQDELWDDISERAGFFPANGINPEEVRSLLVLTYTGSLLLLSPPYEKKIRRKYIYQSIYASNLPAEGNLALLNPIHKHGPVRATRFTTSAVRKLGASPEQRWDEHRATFARLHRTLGSANTPHGIAVSVLGSAARAAAPAAAAPARAPSPVAAGAVVERPVIAVPAAAAPPPAQRAALPKPAPRLYQRDSSANTIVSGTPRSAAASSPDLADMVPAARGSEPDSLGFRPSFSNDPDLPRVAPPPEPSLPSVFVQVLHRERQRSQAKEQETAARAELRGLLARLVGLAGERDHALEAEILGQVMHLQTLGAERGEVVLAPASLSKLETENNDYCAVQSSGLFVGKVGGQLTLVKGGTFAGQSIVKGAPVAILSADASLFAVLGNVRSWSAT